MTMDKTKFLIIALVVSLSLNLAIGGFFAGRFIGHDDRRHDKSSFYFDRRAALKELDGDKKDKVREIWKKNKAELRQNFRSYRQNKREIAKLLARDPLNQEALDTYHQKMMENSVASKTLIYNSLLETARQLSPEEREEFFKSGYRWRDRHHKDK